MSYSSSKSKTVIHSGRSRFLGPMLMVAIGLSAFSDNIYQLLYPFAPRELQKAILDEFTREGTQMNPHLAQWIDQDRESFLFLLYAASFCSLLVYSLGFFAVYLRQRCLSIAFLLFTLLGLAMEFPFSIPFFLKASVAMCSALYILFGLEDDDDDHLVVSEIVPLNKYSGQC